MSNAVYSLGAKWSSRRPELSDRIRKAVEIVNKKNVLPSFSSGTFLVKGSDLYRVKVSGENKGCSCPDFQAKRVSHCKHMLAVALLMKIDSLPSIPAIGYGLVLPSAENFSDSEVG